MIGTTEWVECKEKALDIIADWLWVLAVIIGKSIGIIQGELLDYCINVQEQWKRLMVYCILAQGKRLGYLEN